MKSLQNTLAGVLFRLAPTPAVPRVCKATRPKGPRRQEIEAQHRAGIYRALSYRLRQEGLSGAAQEALEREAEAWAAAGPDFTHYRAKSHHGRTPAHGLTFSQVAQLRHEFNRLTGRLWEQREKGTQGTITPATRRVFEAMLFLAGQYERLFPSYERIARLAKCCRRSVATALKLLEQLGFITRHRRLKIVQGALGRKAEQDTNAYELHAPRGLADLLRSLFKPTSKCKDHPATATEVFSYLRAHPETWGSPCSTLQDAAYGGG